jgi:tetratricopeptide (TPR) repeat protein
MRNGRSNFRTGRRWTARLAAVLTLVAAAAVLRAQKPEEPGWGVDALRHPVDALQKSLAPWPLMERLLDAGETAAVENYRRRLSLPRQSDHDRRAASLLALYAGDYAGALQLLDEVSSRDTWTLQQKKYLEGLLEATRDFAETPSDHFRLRTRPEDSFLEPYVLKALENAHSRMAEVFRFAPSTPLVVEIYPTAERFSAASTLDDEALERSGAIGICKFGRLMILSPQALPLGYRWLDALAHEYNHDLINRLSGGLCPLWLHEGVARYFETSWRRAGTFEHTPAAETQLAEAALSTTTTGQALIPFSRMEPSMIYLDNQQQVSLAFAQVSDAVGYIIDRFGAEKLAALLAAFRRYPREQAFERVLDLTEAELEEAWRESLATRSWTVSKGAIAQRIQLRPVDEADFVGPDAQGHIRLGDRLRRDQPAAALIQYRKALEAEPDNGVALTKAARVYLAMEKPDKAEEHLRRAVEKNPSYPTPFVLLGELLFEDGRYEEAQQILQEALEINPYHPRIHELLGLVALDVGNFSAAKQSLELALRLNPPNAAEIQQVIRKMPKDPR